MGRVSSSDIRLLRIELNISWFITRRDFEHWAMSFRRGMDILIVVVDTKLNCSELVTWYYQYSQSQLCRDWDNTQDNIMIHKVSGEMPAHSQSSLMLITSCNYICLLLSCSATFSKHTIINGNQTRGSRGRAMEGISFIFNAFPLPYTAESIILLPWKCFWQKFELSFVLLQSITELRVVISGLGSHCWIWQMRQTSQWHIIVGNC